MFAIASKSDSQMSGLAERMVKVDDQKLEIRKSLEMEIPEYEKHFIIC